jgi:hypothetical protein
MLESVLRIGTLSRHHTTVQQVTISYFKIVKSAIEVYLNFLKIFTVQTLKNNAHKNLLHVLTMCRCP